MNRAAEELGRAKKALAFIIRGDTVDMEQVRALLAAIPAVELVKVDLRHNTAFIELAVVHYHEEVLLAINEVLAADGLLGAETMIGRNGAVCQALHRGQRSAFVLDVIEKLPEDDLLRCATITESPPWLWTAAADGKMKLVEALMERLPSSMWAYPDSRGWTPLHMAAMNGRQEMAQLLLQRMPEAALAKDKEGKLARDYAKGEGVQGLFVTTAKGAIGE